VKAPQKTRLDILVHERGIAESRQKAQSLILAGKILVNGQKITKAGTAVPADSILDMIGTVIPYVGRGGLKLAAALQRWKLDITGFVSLDIGSSTGGFTDCLLQNGAIRVHAVDAGTNQLDWKLRNDNRVHLMENTNARYLQFDQIGEHVDIVCIDVSFISVKLILPALIKFCRPGTQLVLLIKPQFEAGREQVGKGGIVRDEAVQQNVVSTVQQAVLNAGFRGLEVFPCPVLGAEGNQEYLLHGTFELEQPPQAHHGQVT
jgi:23S rRNA (cytidine1920-2'-O)/16S rRNA (cytidine1409-2'-O)-methyltransferase